MCCGIPICQPVILFLKCLSRSALTVELFESVSLRMTNTRRAPNSSESWATLLKAPEPKTTRSVPHELKIPLLTVNLQNWLIRPILWFTEQVFLTNIKFHATSF